MKFFGWNLIYNNMMLPPTPTQYYLVWIRLQCKNSILPSFTISKWLKKYYDDGPKIYSHIVSTNIIFDYSKVLHSTLKL